MALLTNDQWQEALVQMANSSSNGNIPAIVQKASNITGSGAKTVAVAFTSNVTAGNSIIVSLGLGEVPDASTIILTITDTLGHTYTSAVTASQSTTLYAAIYYVTNILGGANTVTLTLTGASSANEALAAEIYEVSGLIALTPSAVDQTATGTSSGGTAVTTSVVSPALPNEYAFMAISAGNGVITAGTSWTLDSGSLAPLGGNLIKFGSQSRLHSQVTTITPAATLGSSVAWAAACASFKSISIPVSGTVSLLPRAQGWIAATGTGTASQDDAFTFPNQVKMVVLYNSATVPVPFEFDQTSTANSIPIQPGQYMVFDSVLCTSVHVFPSATLTLNTAGGLYVKGWI